MLTTQQRRLFLGAICEGLSTESALEYAGLTLADLASATDSDPAFRLAHYLAAIVRDKFLEQMEAAECQG